VFTFDSDDDSALNPYFEMAGYPSRNAVVNLGSTFIFLAADCCLLLVIGLVKLTRINTVYEWLKKHLLWSYFLRFLIQQCVTMFLASMINIQQFT